MTRPAFTGRPVMRINPKKAWRVLLVGTEALASPLAHGPRRATPPRRTRENQLARPDPTVETSTQPLGLEPLARRVDGEPAVASSPPMSRPPTWTADLAVGIPLIDAQHRELFERVGALVLAADAGCGPAELEPMIAFLREYAELHFAAEERAMELTGYPGLAAHRTEHLAFTEQAHALASRFALRGNSRELRGALLGYVSGWLMEHIQGSDQAFGRHILVPRSSRWERRQPAGLDGPVLPGSRGKPV